MKLELGNVQTISQIVARIKFLESIKDEYKKKRAWNDVKRINACLRELYLVLGVK